MNAAVKRHTSKPHATDYGVGMRPLTGRSVHIAGLKVDGTPYTRVLVNCSYVPKSPGMHIVEGLDRSSGELRAFRLSGIESLRLVVGGPSLRGVDLCATIDHHLANGRGETVQVLIDEDVAA